MSKPKEIGHLVLNVTDIDRSVAFYCDVVGFQQSRYTPAVGAFLTCGVIHHNLALFKASADSPPPQKGHVGLNHFAFKVENYEALQQAHDRLVEAGAVINSVTDHGITRSVYFQDPDGIVMELFADAFADQEEGMRYIRSTRAHADPLDITAPEPPQPEIPAEAAAR
jgi:catechol 2,3-dioxygenase